MCLQVICILAVIPGLVALLYALTQDNFINKPAPSADKTLPCQNLVSFLYKVNKIGVSGIFTKRLLPNSLVLGRLIVKVFFKILSPRLILSLEIKEGAYVLPLKIIGI